MKLVRYGRPGFERPGAIDADGKLRDLGRVIKDVTPAALAPAMLKKLRSVNLARLPVVRGRPRLGCPLAGMGKMIFSVASLIAYVSRFMSLRAGDVISTGTPAGVGHGAKPPRYLQPGDVVEMGISGLGTQRHKIVESK